MEKFRKILQEKYLFHIHTNYTDAHISIKDYFDFALEKKIKTIIFTEHVRKKLDYDFRKFVDEIKTIAADFSGIDYLIGVEAKILPGGDLDINENILSDIEIICFACHAFPLNINLYYNSFIALFSNEKWGKYIRVWVHPGRFLKKNNILYENIKILNELILFAKQKNIYIEHNLKESLPPEPYIIGNDSIIKGYDIHTKSNLENIIL